MGEVLIEKKERPILFSTPMVQAILEGRKTMTRRVMKLQPGDGEHYECLGGNEWAYMSVGGMSGPYTCPYGNVGDILWVRETFFNDADFGEPPAYVYKADNEDYPRGSSVWKPSIFMPKEAARIWLEIVDVKVERLQDISRGDAMSEGCPFPNMAKETSPCAWFSKLWQKINGEESWNENPFVWCISFKVISHS
jgi:hypothetical protein